MQSIFTGLNNVYCNTVTSTAYDEYFGFTAKEVEDISCSLDLENKLDEVKAWYDGYRFDDEEIYCPWDVIHYLADLFDDANANPRNHWENTSSNDIIESFISGGTITKITDENITYDTPHSTDNNIWSILLMRGYLTASDEKCHLSEDEVSLKIPNREIMNFFSSPITRWVSAVTEKADLGTLSKALLVGRRGDDSE